MAEEYSAEEGDAGGENDTSDGGDEALFPSGGGEEEGGVDEREERKNAEEEGEHATEIEEHVGASGAFKVSIARCGNFTTEDTESTEVEKKKTAGLEF